MSLTEAQAANVDTAVGAAALAAGVPLLHVSTSYLGKREFGSSSDPHSFRNNYEWSKAASEEAALSNHEDCLIVRVPQLIGRRSDGSIAKFNGIYSLLKAYSLGLTPAFVADPGAQMDVAGVDEAANCILDTIGNKPTNHVSLSCGYDALYVSDMLRILSDRINRSRAQLGVPTLKAVPIVDHETWNRLYWPFTRDLLSPLERHAIQLIMAFAAYTKDYLPPSDRIQAGDAEALFTRCLDVWIESRGPRIASEPRLWGAA